MSLLVALGAGCGAGEAPPAPAEPQPDYLPQLARSLSRAPENLKLRVMQDGTQVAEVVRGFQHATVVVVTDAGLESRCVTNVDDARELLEGRSE